MRGGWRGGVRFLLTGAGVWLAVVSVAVAQGRNGLSSSPRQVRGPLSMVLPELTQQGQRRGGRAGRTSGPLLTVVPPPDVQATRQPRLPGLPGVTGTSGGASGLSPASSVKRAGRSAFPAARAVGPAGAETVIRPVRRRRSIRDYSWIYIDPPEQREIKVHDIITIIVDEKAEVTVRSRLDRVRNANLKAELREFVRIGETGNLTNAAESSPTIDTNLQSRLNTTGRVRDEEGVRYRIAATVVDVLPNGNLVLEARKTIRTTQGVWEYRLTGELRAEDVGPDNTAYSENIANLRIEKTQKGTVFGSTKRPWGVFLYDLLSPF